MPTVPQSASQLADQVNSALGYSSIDARILVVGERVCDDALQAYRDGRVGDLLCVDKLADAEQIMDDGYDCDAIVVDQSLFASKKETQAWAARNSHAMFIPVDVHSS